VLVFSGTGILSSEKVPSGNLESLYETFPFLGNFFFFFPRDDE